MKEYVEQRNGGFYVKGKRVSLDSIIWDYRSGASAEDIRSAFPVLTLEEVHGALAYYLANQDAVDASILAEDREFEKWSAHNYEQNKEWYKRMAATRQAMLQQR